MMVEKLFDLQLFAEDEGDEGAEGGSEATTGEEEVGFGESGEEEEGQSYRTQEEVDRAIENRLARERRKMARMFGVNKLEEAAPLFQVGQAVSKASGLKPNEVLTRLSGYTSGGRPAGGSPTQVRSNFPTNRPGAPPQGGDPNVAQHLTRIESMLSEERQEKVVATQEAEAKKEFGKLYESHREDIADKADELGLSLVDAATIVLRPKLKEHLETQQREKQQLKGGRRVEGSGGSPGGGGGDFSSALTSSQKETAKKFGISYEAYHKQLKRRGKV